MKRSTGNGRKRPACPETVEMPTVISTHSRELSQHRFRATAIAIGAALLVTVATLEVIAIAICAR